eukprot:3094657-Prymnesium_polylepis.1
MGDAATPEAAELRAEVGRLSRELEAATARAAKAEDAAEDLRAELAASEELAQQDAGALRDELDELRREARAARA